MQPHRTSWPARESVAALPIGIVSLTISMASPRSEYTYLLVVLYLSGIASRIASFLMSRPIGMAPFFESHFDGLTVLNVYLSLCDLCWRHHAAKH